MLARIKKIPVKIHPLFLLMVGLIGYLHTHAIFGTMVWGMIITFSILLHEYGHAITASLYGQKCSIQLMAFGGLTSHTGKKKLNLWQEFFVVFNGPLIGLTLGALSYFLLVVIDPADLLKDVLTISVIVNIFWTVVNLFPVLPLDGGHLLRIGLESLFGIRGVKWAAMLSVFFSIGVSALFFLYNMMIPGILFIFFATDSYRYWETVKGLSLADRETKFQEKFEKAKKMILSGYISSALEELQEIRHLAKSGILYRTATEEMAKIHADHGEFKHAYDLLKPLKNELEGVLRYLLFTSAYHAAQWDTVKEMGDELFREFPSPETAWMNAAAHAVLKEVQAAVGWLRCAQEEGAQDLHKRVEQSCFDPIRQNELFIEWLSE